MALFAVLARQPRPALDAAIQRAYVGHNRMINSNTYLLRERGTSKDVYDKLGMDAAAKGDFAGVIIFRVTADFFGRSTTEFWEWVAQSIEDVDG